MIRGYGFRPSLTLGRNDEMRNAPRERICAHPPLDGKALRPTGPAACGRAAAVSLNSVERSSALDIAVWQRRWRGSHFDLVLREFVAQRHCCSQRLDKSVVRRLNVAIKLDDKEFVVENVKTIVIAHKTPPKRFGTSIPSPAIRRRP